MRKWLSKFKKDERGLTLVELLAVIVILAIVGAIAFVAIGNVMENSRKDAHIANAQQIIAAAKLYDASVKNLESMDTPGQVGTDELQNAELLGQLTDPWGETEDYTAIVKKTKDDAEAGAEFDGVLYEITVTRGSDNFVDNYEIKDATEIDLNKGREAFSNWSN